MNKLLFKSETSLLSSHIEVRKEEAKAFLIIEAEEEHKAWGEKLFPGDDRDYKVHLIPFKIQWEVPDINLLEKVNHINTLFSPMILFTYEGLEPKILKEIDVIDKEALLHLEKDYKLFPYNPKEERYQKMLEEEENLSNINWDEI